MAEDFNSISDYDFGKLSKINSAGLVNSTLSNLWSSFFDAYKRGHYSAANANLDCIWTILGGERGINKSPEERSYLLLEKNIAEIGQLLNGADIKGFNVGYSEEIIKLVRNHRKLLLDKAMFLRRLQNSQGKGTAYHDGEDEEFD